jgi:hypothetical protein
MCRLLRGHVFRFNPNDYHAEYFPRRWILKYGSKYSNHELCHGPIRGLICFQSMNAILFYCKAINKIIGQTQKFE